MRYQHRVERYVVTAEKELHNDCYIVYGYRCCGRPPKAEFSVAIAVNDFEKLFEPVPEYCCDWFRKCVRNRIIRKSTVSGQQEWVWDALDEWFTQCPFCKTKL